MLMYRVVSRFDILPSAKTADGTLFFARLGPLSYECALRFFLLRANNNELLCVVSSVHFVAFVEFY